MRDSSVVISGTSVSAPRVAVANAGVQVNPVRFGDLREVARLQRRAFKPKLAYGFGTLMLLWSLPSVKFVVARNRGRIVGCAIGDRNGGQSRVVNICVDPDEQRQGIGSSLLRSIETVLTAGDVVLMVEAENVAARKLYLKEGYKEVGVSKNYYGRGKDGFWMQKMRVANPQAKIRI